MKSLPDWPVPREGFQLILHKDEVHLWRARLNVSEQRLRQFQATLSVEEAARANRFRHTCERERFVSGRGTLRQILGKYLHIGPKDVLLSTTVNGKPILAPQLPEQSGTLCFNLSHSSDIAVYAFSWDRQVGIDIEAVRSEIAVLPFAKRFFSPAEVDALIKLTGSDQRQAFFHCWAAKEAYVKARGDGLDFDLKSFDICFTPRREIRLLATRPDALDAIRWSLFSIALGSEYAAALAVENGFSKVSCYQWPIADSPSF